MKGKVMKIKYGLSSSNCLFLKGVEFCCNTMAESLIGMEGNLYIGSMSGMLGSENAKEEAQKWVRQVGAMLHPTHSMISWCPWCRAKIEGVLEE